MNLIRKLLPATVPIVLAALALTASILPAPAWATAVLATAALVLPWWRHRSRGLNRDRFSRGIAVAALAVVAARSAEGADIPAAIVGGTLIGIIGFERLLAQAIGTGYVETANLSVRRSRKTSWFTPRTVYTATSVSSGVFAVAATAAPATGVWPVWTAAGVVALLGAGLAAGVLGAWFERRRSAHSGDGAVVRAVNESQPKFIVHFSGPPGSCYQLHMWLPYLDQLGDPYLIVIREPEHLDELREGTQAPVVVVPSISALEQLLSPSVKAAFYVNSAAVNTQLVRFSGLTHVQLMHGESDKASSFNKVTAIYDRVFVAGQAAIDRYRHHGIDIPDSRFRSVGRPQLAEVLVGERVEHGLRRTLLYAPTWTGLASEFDYSSLAIGKHIVKAALARDMVVILRTHPYTRFNLAAARRLDEIERVLTVDRQQSGRPHLWGSDAAGTVSLADCINAADIAVCDVSAVAADWIYCDRPFAVTDMKMLGESFADEVWIARGASRIAGDASNLDEVFDELLVKDSRAAQRREARAYFLGEDSGEDLLARFTSAAREAYER